MSFDIIGIHMNNWDPFDEQSQVGSCTTQQDAVDAGFDFLLFIYYLLFIIYFYIIYFSFDEQSQVGSCTTQQDAVDVGFDFLLFFIIYFLFCFCFLFFFFF